MPDKSPDPPSLFIVVALPCEAQPLIELLVLRKQADKQPFRVYRNETITLVVCGIGQALAASAVGFAAGRYGVDPATRWLNIGICGHASADPGSWFMVEEFSGECEDNVYRLEQSFASSLERKHCHTVSRVEQAFRGDFLYDMEGVAFTKSALKFSDRSHIHSAKVVSDNRDSGTGHLNRESIRALIDNDRQMLKRELIDPLMKLRPGDLVDE